MKSMGGGISGAKKLVKKMKDRKRNADSSQTRMALYKAYPEPKKKAERVKYTTDPEPKKKAERVKYATDPEPKKKARNIR